MLIFSTFLPLLVSIISAIIIFSIIVIIHECGHYFSAKRHWVKIEEFWLWLPPRWKVLWKNKLWTAFTLNWIPFWWFVRMAWEDSHNPEDRKKKWSFWSVSLLWRMEIVLAWVFMNFILAWWLLIALFMIWTQPIILSQNDFTKYQNEWYIVMEEEFDWVKIINPGTVNKNNLENLDKNNILENSPGVWFEKWDIIKKINWEDISDSKRMIELQKEWWEFVYNIERWSGLIDFTLNIEKWEKLWISISSRPWVKEIKNIKLWFFDSVIYSFKECFRISISTVNLFWDMIWKIFTEWKTPEWVSWPVWIAKMTWWMVNTWDFNWVLKLMALISLSLAVVNILPIPALDWWRFMFLLIEWIIRRPLSANLEAYVNLWWYLFLMWLLILVTIKDVIWLF
jgi:regulator of sigma E protease